MRRKPSSNSFRVLGSFLLRRVTLRLLLACSLVVALVAPTMIVAAGPWSGGNGQGRSAQGPRPVPGAPEANLPNLNEARRSRPALLDAPPPVPSTMRSRRNPLAPRNGRRVGDPLPPLGKASDGAQFDSGTNSKSVVARRGSSPTVREGSNSESAGDQLSRHSHHARKNAGTSPKPAFAPASMSTAPPPPPVGDDQYVQNFFQAALARPPSPTTTPTEQAYWNDILRAAYSRGQPSMVMAARELGKTLFESSDYAARNRDNHWYVYDLYKSYCLRDPDSGGWAYWESMVPSQGREAVRRAFDESAEFIAIVATITPNGSASGAASSLLSARVDPVNQPGSGLLGRDAQWSLPLLSLPGRSGLDLGLALSYSSMVWTRSGPYIYFDEDNGSPSPGFRLGFPTVQEQFFDAQVGQNAYVLITPGGGRTELRQVGSSTTYEAADSSYLQLVDNGSSLLVRATDGTQLSYTKLHNEWRCNQVKDRNGNYLTVNYNWLGQITTITDTLARLITFNYDGNANLSSITQTWNGLTHQWASFGWGNLQMYPSFSQALAVGAANGSVIPVLTQVGLADNSRSTFEYNSNGQVNVIRRYTSDNIQRSYTAYNYESPAADCPRISATRVWAENWTGINSVPTEVVTQYSEPGDGSHQMVAPDGTVYKEFYGAGWQKGLTTLSEVWSGGIRQKWTTSWTQDNTGVNYQTNPRPTETNVSDAGSNRRRTTVDYTTFTLPSSASCSLPSDVREYQSDATTEYRRTHTEYVLSSAYLNQRLIGLPDTAILFDGNNLRLSETHYGYDWAAHLEAMPGGVNPVQHDGSYNTSFTTRGNLVIVTRTNVDTNPPPPIEMKYGYNVAGSVTFTRDMLWHQNFFSYNDSFSDLNNSRNTWAYPTMVADNDWNATYLRYNFDFGSNTRHKGPPAAGNAQGAAQTWDYDSAGRLERTTMTDNGAYTRYVYGPNYVQSFSTVNNVADDSYSIQTFDGAGRVIGTAGYHPGSTGGFKAQMTIYDLMGRAIKQSNPAEINGGWVPTGDDALGWLYTQQTYDWKGRPLITINTDDTPTNPSRKEINYSGCGCAGGEVVTLTDEVGRRQKAYSDVFGRTSKTEVLNWDGSVYSAATNTYNQRDQVTFANAYSGPATGDGSCPAGTCQQTAMTYDGFGRLKTKHVPEQNAGTATAYEYFADDQLQKVTDARDASATYAYNGRHQVTGITYAAPSGITPTPNVSFAYDAVGNRTSMTDGSGSVSYSYNQLSRLMAETRTFAGLTGSFTLSYGYNLAGQLTTLTEPAQFGSSVGYAYDQAGRLSNVTGAGFAGGISQFASNMKYRAWSAVKELDYGNGLKLNHSFNSRLQLTNYQVKVPNTPVGQGERVRSDYEYFPDGLIKLTYDRTDEQFNRGYSYDHLSRLINAETSSAAYFQTFYYDAFSNMTQRGNGSWRHYDTTVSQYLNNRNTQTIVWPTSYPSCCPPQPSYWTYDADGRLRHDHNKEYSYDAAGNKTRVLETTQIDITLTKRLWIYQDYDANGVRAKRVEQTQYNSGAYTFVTSYYLRSSVLDDQVVTELNEYGQKRQTFIYADGAILAKEKDNQATWVHIDPVTNSARETNSAANLVTRVEFDPVGNDAPLTDPQPPEITPDYEYLGNYGNNGNPYDGPSGCSIDGQPVPCSFAMGFINIGAAAVCPNNNCGPRHNGSGWEFWNPATDWAPFGEQRSGSHSQKRPTLKKGRSRVRQVSKATRPRRTQGTPQGEESRIGRVDTNALIFGQITIEHFDALDEQRIRAELPPLFTRSCSWAFEIDAHLFSPAVVVLLQGLVIRPSNDLFKYSAAELGLVSEDTRHSYAMEFSSMRAQEGAIPSVRNGVQLTTDGRAQIYLHQRAFWGESFLNATFSLEDVLSHSMIHIGGQGPKPDTLGKLGFRHDLSGFKHHNRILEACR